MTSYLDLLYGFQQSELRTYIGEKTVALLAEWMPDGDTLLTKKRMIAMIDSLYGNSILKNSSFRKNLLLNMKSDEILAIRDNCLSGKEKNILDSLHNINEQIISNLEINNKIQNG